VTLTTTRIERSGGAIRTALAQVAPAECEQFESEFRQAATRAGEAFDLAPLEAVLDRWWGIAAIRTNPLSRQEQAQLEQAGRGEFDGMWERDETGRWAQL